jgi:hypothetical protein
MEPEGSLPCSQETFTGPSPEPDRSSPYHPNLSYLSKTYFNIVHPSTSLSPSGLFPSGFPTNVLYAFLFSPVKTINFNYSRM